MAARLDNHTASQERAAGVIHTRNSNSTTVTFGANVVDGGCVDYGWSPNNPFLASMKLTQAANGAADPTFLPQLDTAWPPTPPPSGSTNPFTKAAVQQRGDHGESAAPADVKHTAATPLRPTEFTHITDQYINPFTKTNRDYFTTSTPVFHTQAPFQTQTVPQIASHVPSHVTPSYAVQGQTYDHSFSRTDPPPLPLWGKITDVVGCFGGYYEARKQDCNTVMVNCVAIT
ncbi:Hypothetical predicted protein [Xyrichtys novacula]|uniref:Uncharacterized protein n=1 Tax=Xyrichtys novacula TaxID=13765 RepID=A0AAV1GLA4_XYRNO|nr:Hypothetical predicted protein [Xyrichtys novacula]